MCVTIQWSVAMQIELIAFRLRRIESAMNWERLSTLRANRVGSQAAQSAAPQPDDLIKSYALLSAGRGSVFTQPGCELRFLLRFEIDAVVNLLDRLTVRSLGGCDLVCRIEGRHFVAHSGRAE
jgi:hypothetical protein